MIVPMLLLPTAYLIWRGVPRRTLFWESLDFAKIEAGRLELVPEDFAPR
jgi:hypothetical protein